jgi:hypothetical protein
MTKKKKIFRHGDVLLKEVDPFKHKRLKEIEKGDRVVIAEGEATGHMHALEFHRKSDNEVLQSKTPKYPIRFLTLDDGRFVQVLRDVVLTHQEHKTLQIPKGFYEITIEREYDYLEADLREADRVRMVYD